METQTNIGDKAIGTKESEKQKLEPAKVKIVNFRVEPVSKSKADKVVFEVKHPNRDDLINISTANVLKNKAVITAGTWLNYDEDELIVKNSQLAYLMNFLGAKTLNEMKDKECETEMDDKGYLCFKAY